MEFVGCAEERSASINVDFIYFRRTVRNISYINELDKLLSILKYIIDIYN